MTDAYARAGVDQTARTPPSRRWSAACGAIDTGKPSRVVPLPGHYASVLRLDDRDRPGDVHRHRGHQDGRRRAPRPLRHDRDRLRGDERQRRDLRRRGADRDARLRPHRASRPRDLRAARGRARAGSRARRASRSPAARSPRSAEIVSGHELGRNLRRARRARRDRHRRRGRARRPRDRAALLGPALERLHAGAPGARRRSRWTTSASAGRSATSCSSRPRSTCGRSSSCSRSPVDVRGLVHITGDGLDNLLRLEAEVGYEIDDPLPVPPVFGLIQELGRASPTTRCTRSSTWAAGSAASSPPPTRGPRSSSLRGHYPEAKRIGRATDRAGEVRRR